MTWFFRAKHTEKHITSSIEQIEEDTKKIPNEELHCTHLDRLAMKSKYSGKYFDPYGSCNPHYMKRDNLIEIRTCCFCGVTRTEGDNRVIHKDVIDNTHGIYWPGRKTTVKITEWIAPIPWPEVCDRGEK